MFLYAATIASLPLSGAVRPIYVQAKFIPKIKIPAYPFARKSQNFGFAEHFRENGSNFLKPLSTIMSKPRLGCNNHICLADNLLFPHVPPAVKKQSSVPTQKPPPLLTCKSGVCVFLI